MASPLAAEEPTFLLEFSNDVANLHDLTTVERSSVLDHVAVHVCFPEHPMRDSFCVSLIESANQLGERRNYCSVPGTVSFETFRIDQVWINEHRGSHPQFVRPI